MKRLKINYRDRYISSDRTEARDYPRTIYALYTWRVSGLLYCQVDRFNVRVICTDLIDSIEEV